MAYNYYSNNVNPYAYQQQYQAPLQAQQMPQPQPLQIQNGGFISVRCEQDARNYPVAPGNSVTFKDETEPYVYTKTMGFSQLDRPIFEKYKLIKEDIPEEAPAAMEVMNNGNNDVQRKLEDEINRLWKEVNTLKNNTRKQNQNQKREVTNE